MGKSSVRNLHRLVAAVAIGLLATAAAAQEWKPSKTVELVVGSAPGGSPDIMARLV